MAQRIADIFLEREEQTLSPYAFLTKNTRGRDHPYVPCENRTEFQRDRDRILHSKSFRRLMHKTQVFLFPADEHYRTRMTHTLEVTQVARIIARALQLNEDLTEAAALGHDLGHTPFGHAGEVAMQQCYSPDFTHYKQSVRVVEKLEKDGEGLNLTWEVRDGILNHTGSCMASTLEGVIVKFADRIAYINHDIDDACRAGILSLDDIPKELLDTLGRGHSERINRMVTSVITASAGKPEIAFTPEIGEATMQLRKFLFDHVYTNPLAKSEDKKAQELLVRLFEYYVKHPEEMPDLYYRNTKTEPVERCVCDFVGGMTDRYAIDRYTELFIPQVWRGRQI
ncbi:MAG: deoxyguanosinetriphosphate triphosphohydrolase [Oscillospiraceae bacterium]|jgi:dGTPase|nr:MAG: deoxyguanosinetriphosphate triphosphohydrolase [Oscillospiraceae bacterium]